MRRFAALAVLAAAMFLAASSFTVKQAHAGWIGANVDPACPGNGGLAGDCPSVGEACNSWAMFYNPPDPAVIEILPDPPNLGYDCVVRFFCCGRTTNTVLTQPTCDVTKGDPPSNDPKAASGCSFLNPFDKEQLGCGLKKNGSSDLVGNPINVAFGNKCDSVTDYMSQGPDWLTFVRYYNSLSDRSSMLGTGWRSNFDRQIVPRFFSLGVGNIVLLVRPDGAVYEFDPNGSGYVANNPDIDGVLATDGATIYTFTDSNDTVETYGYSSGQLLSIRTRSGTRRRSNMTAAAISLA